MKSNVLNIEACCVWCRKPTAQCTMACDDAGTYSGVLIQGEWRDLEASAPIQDAAPAPKALTTT
jgi:hypothetical protein